jgi:hypothetical protein
VLTVLALMGVVALTATLLAHSGRSAPKPVRSAAPKPVRVVARKPTLHSELQQLLQQFPAGPLRAGPPGAQPQVVSPPFNATPCPVASCSINPCVQFAQGGTQPVASTVQAAVASPALPGGPRAQRCIRHALPHTLRVSSAVVVPVSMSVGTQQPAPARSF